LADVKKIMNYFVISQEKRVITARSAMPTAMYVQNGRGSAGCEFLRRGGFILGVLVLGGGGAE